MLLNNKLSLPLHTGNKLTIQTIQSILNIHPNPSPRGSLNLKTPALLYFFKGS